MQAVTQESYQDTTEDGGQAQGQGLVISYEVIAYALLIALSLWLRVAELDTVPLSSREATQALAAWRAINPELPGAAIVPQSPLLFTLHGLSFSIFGASEFSVRILTALAGALLVVSPLLFREVLGQGRAFLFSLLLTFSPVLLVASRVDSPAVWSLACALLGLLALWRWWQRREAGYALLATGLFTALLLLTDPAGFVLGLILIGAAAVTLVLNRFDNPDDDPVPDLLLRLRGWPWGQALLVALVTVFALATAFMFHLPGLSAVSALLDAGITGIVTPQPGAPPFFALLTALVYEPVLWLLALLAVWLLIRRGSLTLLDRFLAVWVLLAGAASLIYQGTGPQHALWLILPMTGLVTALAVDLLEPDKHPFLEIPWWGKLVTALVMFALLTIFAISFQSLTRALLSVPGDAVVSAPFNRFSIIGVILVLSLMVVGYFFVSSLWGAAAPLKGGGLGLLAFALITSLGSGWAAAVTNVDNPIEFWQVEPVGREVFLLQESLQELARRESGGFPNLTVYVQADDSDVVAWVLRDFVNIQYIRQPTEGRTQEVVLLPILAEPPDLGGSYVGQDFIIKRIWRLETLQGLDFLPWWLQRRTRVPDLPLQSMVLWLRQDIYDGAPFEVGE